MARRLCRLKRWVRNSTAMQSSVSKAWRSSSHLASVFKAVRCTRLASQVEPISTRRKRASMCM